MSVHGATVDHRAAAASPAAALTVTEEPARGGTFSHEVVAAVAGAFICDLADSWNFVLDTENNIVFTNDHIHGATGWTVEQAQGKSFSVLVPREQWAVTREFFASVRAKAGREVASYEFSLLTRSGGEAKVESKCQAVGPLIAVKSVSVVLLEHKMRKALAERDGLKMQIGQFRHLLSQSDHHLFLVQDARGVVVDCFDQGARCILGDTREELMGVNAFDRIYAEDRASIRATYDALSPGESVKKVFRRIRKDGSMLYVQCEAMCVLGEGEVKQIIAVETVYTREYMRALDTAGEELVRSVAHDIKQPVEVISNTVELLLAMLDEFRGIAARGPGKGLEVMTGRMARIIRLVDAETRYLNRLVEEFIIFEKFRLGQYQTFHDKRVPFSLFDTVRQVSLSLKRFVEGNRMVYRHRLIDSSHIVYGCPSLLLNRVLNNLVANAVKAMGECAGEKKVTVSMEVKSEIGDHVTVRFEVEDTGPGIPAGEIEKIFQSYVQPERDRGKYGNLGLGLWLCKLIVEGHGGIIGVTSSPGEGAIFFFEIPFPIVRGAEARLVEEQDSVRLDVYSPVLTPRVTPVDEVSDTPGVKVLIGRTGGVKEELLRVWFEGKMLVPVFVEDEAVLIRTMRETPATFRLVVLCFEDQRVSLETARTLKASAGEVPLLGVVATAVDAEERGLFDHVVMRDRGPKYIAEAALSITAKHCGVATFAEGVSGET